MLPNASFSFHTNTLWKHQHHPYTNSLRIDTCTYMCHLRCEHQRPGDGSAIEVLLAGALYTSARQLLNTVAKKTLTVAGNGHN